MQLLISDDLKILKTTNQIPPVRGGVKFLVTTYQIYRPDIDNLAIVALELFLQTLKRNGSYLLLIHSATYTEEV